MPAPDHGADRMHPCRPNHRAILSSDQMQLDSCRTDVIAQTFLPEFHTRIWQLHQSSEDGLIILDTLHEIYAMLDTLPPKARTAFLLAQFEGLTYAEIGIRLYVSVRTVKRYMAQAFEECIMLDL